MPVTTRNQAEGSAGDGEQPLQVNINEEHGAVGGAEPLPVQPLFNENAEHPGDHTQDESRRDSAIYGAIDAAVGLSQANMLQLVRAEMQVAIREAMSRQSSSATNPSNNPPVNPPNPPPPQIYSARNRQDRIQDGIDWPMDLLPPPPPTVRSNRDGQANIAPPEPGVGAIPRRSTGAQGRNSRQYAPRYGPKYPELYKWGIKFDPKTMLIEDFIFRVERLQLTYQCPWEELLAGFHHLLSETIQQWYWSYLRHKRNAVIIWDDFRLDLLREFQRYTSNADVLRQLMDRIQGKDETTGQFIDAALSLRTQLRQPLPDQEFIDILRRNLRPNISALIFGTYMYSIEYFRAVCKKAEDMVMNDWSRRNRPVEVKRTVAEIVEEAPLSVVEVNALQPNSKILCWNCKQLGHIFKDCPSTERKYFCYRCGWEDVIAKNCPRCKGNGKQPLPQTGEVRAILP